MKKITLLAMLVLTLSLAACSKAEPTVSETQPPTSTLTPVPSETPAPTLTPTVTATPTEVPPTATPTPSYPPAGYGPDNFPENVNPLTGLEVSDPQLLKRRPLGIKINTIPRDYNRPPWGLSLADIVYEYYHNDGYARFHAILYGNDASLVGPIRSGRFFDDPLIRMYKSFFVYGGADERIDFRFWSANYASRLVREGPTSPCPATVDFPLCRHDPTGYDLLLVGTRELHEAIAKKKLDDAAQNLNGMFFQLEAPQAGSAGKQVTVRYSTDNFTRWEYDGQSGKYLRFQDNAQDVGQGEEYAPLLDRLNEQQITADNVVVLFIPHQFFTPPPGDIIEIVLNASGPAIAFRDGQAYSATWNHPAADSVMYLTFADGSRYPFKPGNTWFEVVGQYSTTSQPAEGSWRFEMLFP